MDNLNKIKEFINKLSGEMLEYMLFQVININGTFTHINAKGEVNEFNKKYFILNLILEKYKNLPLKQQFFKLIDEDNQDNTILHNMVKFGTAECVELLIDYLKNFPQKSAQRFLRVNNNSSCSALELAIKENKLNMIQTLLEKGTEILIKGGNLEYSYYRSVFWKVINAGYEMTEFFIKFEHSLPVEKQILIMKNYGLILFKFAISNENTDIFQFLIEHNFSLPQEEQFIRSTADYKHHGIIIDSIFNSIIKTCMMHISNVNDEWRNLKYQNEQIIVKQKFIKFFEDLLKYNSTLPKEKKFIDLKNSIDKAVFQKVLNEGDSEIIKILLEYNNTLSEEEQFFENNFFILNAENPSKQLVKLLLEYNINIEIPDQLTLTSEIEKIIEQHIITEQLRNELLKNNFKAMDDDDEVYQDSPSKTEVEYISEKNNEVDLGGEKPFHVYETDSL